MNYTEIGKDGFYWVKDIFGTWIVVDVYLSVSGWRIRGGLEAYTDRRDISTGTTLVQNNTYQYIEEPDD